MRSKLVTGGLVAAVAALLVTHPVVVEAAGQITSGQIKNSTIKGADVKNDSLTGKDINEKSLKQVPSAATAGTAGSAATAASAAKADALTAAPTGSVQSGVFSAGGSADEGYIGFGITFPRKLSAQISSDHVIDTWEDPQPDHCPGPGQAAPGYLCLYPDYKSGVGSIYQDISDPALFSAPALGGSIGVPIYADITAASAYTSGIWSVGAP